MFSPNRSEILDEFLADCLKQKLKQRANFDNVCGDYFTSMLPLIVFLICM